MFWARVAALLLLTCGPLAAQSNPGFQDGQPLCANVPNPLCPGAPGLNQAFMSKVDVAVGTRSCRNFTTLGGRGDGVTDNTATYNAAVGGNGCLYFPAGKYVFGSTPAQWSTSAATDSIAVLGDGADLTELTFPTVGTGLTFSLQSYQNSVHLRSFAITTGTTGAVGGCGASNGCAIRLTLANPPGSPAYGALSDVSGVTFRGNDGYFGGTKYWNIGALVEGLSNVNWVGDYFTGPGGSTYSTLGVGVIVQGSATIYPVAHNFIGSYFNLLGHGVIFGAFTQGLHFITDNFTGVQYGIRILGGGIAPNATELTVVGSQFNAGGSGTNGAGIQFNGVIPNFTATANTIYVPDGATGIAIEANGTNYAITGNMFNLISPAGSANGLAIAAAGTPSTGGQWKSVVSSNVFFNSMGSGGTGLFLQTGSAEVLVIGNAFSSIGTSVINNGTNNRLVAGNNPELSYSVAGLPNCPTVGAMRAFVNNGVATPAYGSAVGATIGTSIQPVFCNSVAWTYQ